MPIPLLVWAGVALAAALLGSGSIYLVNINNIRGKRFTILGTKASGKTTLHNFFSKGEIPAEHIQTSEEKTKDSHFKLNHLNLRIKSSTDIGGGIVFEQRWLDLITRADYICYMVRIDNILNEASYKNTVNRHIDLILYHMQKAAKVSPLHIIFSFCDRVGEYNADRDKFIENFKRNHLDLHRPNTTSYYGSLKDKKHADELCISLISKISEKR